MGGSLRLRRKEASSYLTAEWGLSVAPTTLAKYASVGGGPRYQKFGRTPVYSPADLDEWATDRLSASASSSTEHRALAHARA